MNSSVTFQIIQSDGCRSRMRIQAFSVGQRQNLFSRMSQRLPRITQHTGALDEIINPERGRESRCSGRRQNMVWPGEVIAYNFRSVGPKKYGSRMKNVRSYRLVGASDKLQMLGR